MSDHEDQNLWGRAGTGRLMKTWAQSSNNSPAPGEVFNPAGM